MPWLYLFYTLGIINLITYFKLKSEIKKDNNIYETYFGKRSEKNPAKRSRNFTKYILSLKRWNEGFNPRLLTWIRLYIVISYAYILYGVVGVIAFFLVSSSST